MAEAYVYGSSSAIAPTHVRLENCSRGTAGSRVVESPKWLRIALDEVDSVDWSDENFSCSRVQVVLQ